MFTHHAAWLIFCWLYIMSQIHIFSVGRWKKGPEKTLYEHFQDRLQWNVMLHQLDDKASSFLTPQQVQQNQAEKLLKALAKNNSFYRIALDERGQQLTSTELATLIQQCFNRSQIPAFLIGGDHGLRADLVTSSKQTLAFGKATWPHLLILGMLMEQLYRAQQILIGHPYHRGG